MPVMGRSTGFDTFSRSLVDSWGVSDSGHTWQDESSNHDSFYTAGTLGYGRITVPASSGTDTVYLDVPYSADQEILCKIKWNTDSLTDFGPMLRRSSGSNYFALRIRDNNHQLQLYAVKNGSGTVLATASKTISKDTYYWVRLQISGTTFRVRMWAEGVVEPGTWDATTTISSTTGPASGTPGFRTNGESSTYYVYCDTFYYYDLTETDLGLPVTDTFSRNVHLGAGLSDSGHLWKGAFSDDPNCYATVKKGSVTSSSGYLTFTCVSAESDPRAMIGPVATDVEVWTKVYCDVATGSPFVRIGARATDDGLSAGGFEYGTGEGYVRFAYGSTLLELYRDTTQVATFTLPAAPAAGEIWQVRFQAQGTTLRAKIWKDGTSEPASYQIQATSVASLATSGRAWFRMSLPGATYRIYDFTVSQITNTTAISTGSISTAAVTDTGFTINASYTNDTDNNSTAVLQYREKGTLTWTIVPNTVNRTTKIFSANVTGRKAGTIYEIRATFGDAAGVNGVNPLTGTVTTTLTGTDVSHLELITSDTLGQVTVRAHYVNDTDNDNSATYEYRTLGGTSILNDHFYGDDGTALELHYPYDPSNPEIVWPAVEYWTKIGTGQVKLSGDRFIYPTQVGALHTYKAATVSGTVANYSVDATITCMTQEGEAGLLARVQSNGDYYYAGYTFADEGYWYVGKYVSGVFTVLGTVADTFAIGDSKQVRLSVSGSQVYLLINEGDGEYSLKYFTTDASISAAGTGGILFVGRAATEADGLVIKDFYTAIYSTPGAFSAPVAMSSRTIATPTKYWQSVVGGLANSQGYEFRITFTDADGVRNANPISATIITPGASPRYAATPIDITARDTTAIVTVNYIHDVNDTSQVDIQYKSIRDLLWTTVPQTSITASRGPKTFRTTLGSLTPNLSYQVRTILTDTDGVDFGQELAESAFTTSGAVVDPNKRGKHYLFKLYDRDDVFLGTWRDAPEPKFQWHENGGLSELEVELPRRISSINNDPTIDYGHRIDVWAMDTTDFGMGPNLIQDWDINLGSWTLATSWGISSTGGPDKGKALLFSSASTTQRITLSETIDLREAVPLVISCVAKATGGKLRIEAQFYNSSDVSLGVSDEYAETVGSSWQTLKFQTLPPHDTAYVRIRLLNVGSGIMYADKFSVLQRELLIYRGLIESFEPAVNSRGERVTVTALSLASQLADYEVLFLQYAAVQPSKDADEYPNENKVPTDPSNMMKTIIDMIQDENPRCQLYYTSDSIKLTGTAAEYTFREQQGDDCFDDIRGLCPPDWHWFIEPDGRVNLRGPEHATQHTLRLTVEVMDYSNNHTIENLKNHVTVRGRRDEDDSEPDGQGTITYVAFDQASIDKYGLRKKTIRDSNVRDNDTAKLVGDGRLEEWNTPEESARLRVPDEKDIRFVGNIVGGFNIEAFQPGDTVKLLDPVGRDGRTYWDQFRWDDGAWDDHTDRTLPNDNPIKTIRYSGAEVELELSNRQPTSTGAHAKFLRWLRQVEAKQNRD